LIKREDPANAPAGNDDGHSVQQRGTDSARRDYFPQRVVNYSVSRDSGRSERNGQFSNRSGGVPAQYDKVGNTEFGAWEILKK